MQYVGEIL